MGNAELTQWIAHLGAETSKHAEILLQLAGTAALQKHRRGIGVLAADWLAVGGRTARPDADWLPGGGTMRSRLGTGGGRRSETAVVEQALHYLVHATSILWRNARNLVIRQHKKKKKKEHF